MVALIVTVPSAVVFSESPTIVAPVAPAFATLHVIVLFVAFDGFIVPESINGVITVAVVGTPSILVTGVYAMVTIIANSWI